MWQEKAYYVLLVFLKRFFGVSCIAFSLVYLISLLSFSYTDPSFNSISDQEVVVNWGGSFGSHISDLSFQFMGLASFILCLVIFSIGKSLASSDGCKMFLVKIALIPFCILSFTVAFSSLPIPGWWEFNSLGGVNGAYLMAKNTLFPAPVVTLISFLLSILLLSFIIEISLQDWIYFARYCKVVTMFLLEKAVAFASDVKNKNINLIPGKYFLQRSDEKIEEESQEDDEEEGDEEEEGEESEEDESDEEYDDVQEEDEEDDEEEEEEDDEEEEDSRESLKDKLKRAGNAVKRKIIKSSYQLPDVDLLIDRSEENKNKKISKKFITNQAQSLQQVLSDFGVRGEALDARVGPVVTLHEFEPAAGTKASRVIGLSDDVARSMSAISARIAVVSGKTSLGIEIPNAKRQMIFLREMIESKHYKESKDLLPMILGKDIGGEPVIADLAKMPHLLIAGTTGSGKSVGLNVMILSLLFRLPPDECKFIMIDPKMLELSIYDGIPHLLSPVVTEPAKAVIALKWTVNEMEERYRLMSSFGVRNIMGYNEKAEKAAMNGETLSKKVQTGYNPEDGKPIIEEIEFEPKKIPFIVVIIDEMADLMLVAGKEIESLIQRLAQMARAAGIHIITATQRPSVDVITGVIKANFPTRISFQVTSRIDSRTILGTQGAEQLLGQGDMLYMSGGGKMKRVHGPFCSDEEINDIVKFIKDQEIEDHEDNQQIDFEAQVVQASASSDASGGSGDGGDEDLYARAVAIVRADKKPSISYVQRKLRIGYNRAAILIEKMEEQGVLTPPNVSGKREIIE